MRITLKFLVKSFVAVMFMLFLLPIILNIMDDPEKAGAHSIRNKIKKRAGVAIHQVDPSKSAGGREHIFQAPPAAQNVDSDVVPDGMQYEYDGAAAGQEEEPTKKYGPKAVFKNGVLGNFEPRDVKTEGGPGDGGVAVYTSMQEKQSADQSVREYGFNMVASDKISMTRSIPDTRMDECKYWEYPEKLPNASVIIVFHNEGWSTLMRTVHSVINMSPKHLLHEVVMVDDFSQKEHLKGRLEQYIEQFNGLVKLYRNKERLGLIGTRTLGAEYSTGDVIVFLDAHCECNKNWLVPLLARIAYDRTIMAVPYVDGIDWDNFHYRPTYSHNSLMRGIFEWGFLYKESRVPTKEQSKHQQFSEPHWSPTHAGGLFAMDRNYFFELGAYDPGLQIWGGENFELSFKIWLCGGSIEWVPCSHVGHVYRNVMPYGFGNINPKIPVILLNYMRVVEVWLDDEFKEYFYTREPTIRGYPIGNITDQLEFKKKHAVHDFKWFMDNIAYEVWEKFPAPPPNKRWGEVKEKNGYQCWDTQGQQPGRGQIGLSGCHHFGGNQLYRLNAKGQLATGERCLDASGDGVGIIYCPVSPTGPWDFDEATGLIRHKSNGKCASSRLANKLKLVDCDATDPKQQWDINEVRTW